MMGDFFFVSKHLLHNHATAASASGLAKLKKTQTPLDTQLTQQSMLVSQLNACTCGCREKKNRKKVTKAWSVWHLEHWGISEVLLHHILSSECRKKNSLSLYFKETRLRACLQLSINLQHSQQIPNYCNKAGVKFWRHFTRWKCSKAAWGVDQENKNNMKCFFSRRSSRIIWELPCICFAIQKKGEKKGNKSLVLIQSHNILD